VSRGPSVGGYARAGEADAVLADEPAAWRLARIIH
jgi:hypothetical protein